MRTYRHDRFLRRRRVGGCEDGGLHGLQTLQPNGVEEEARPIKQGLAIARLFGLRAALKKPDASALLAYVGGGGAPDDAEEQHDQQPPEDGGARPPASGHGALSIG